jgi:MFS family permease
MQNHVANDRSGGIDQGRVRRLMIFFALVYVAEGLGQTSGLISQPLNFYLKEMMGWSPVQIASFVAVFNFAWVLLPLYGLVSDFLPLLGYHRTSYLIGANTSAALAYGVSLFVASPESLLLVLAISAYAMAISSTVCGALLVENGRQDGIVGMFVNQQWLWFNVAFMVGSLSGGFLIHWLSPLDALHAAAGLAGLAPLLVACCTPLLIQERRSLLSVDELKLSLTAFLKAFRTREVWLVGAFLFLFFFSPGFYTPLYFYMTDDLKFSQAYIGALGAVSSSGWICAALLFRRFGRNIPVRQFLYASGALGTVVTFSFLLLGGPISAAVINFVSGMSTMAATVAALTLAGICCPKGSEGFTFSALVAVMNLSGTLCNVTGSALYEHVFGRNLPPLIVVSAICTALTLLLVPRLRLSERLTMAPNQE